MNISMNVNGREMHGNVEGRTLLVQFLRDHLGLTGTHVGCDTSQCGACVVHVDGESGKGPAPCWRREASDCSVTTIEGMVNEDGTLGPIQHAFQEHHGLQCRLLHTGNGHDSSRTA